MIKGQTDRDSIIFHGNITNDMKEEEDIVTQYRYNLFCKNNPQNKTLLDTANFAIKCLRGDTIVLEVLSASPFRFQVECIAESDTPTNIHVWNFPKSYNGWHHFDNNKTERLSAKKENLVSTLTGTYQQTLCFDGEEYIWAMMKLVPDGTFEYISNIFNLDGEGGNYLTGTWNVNKDTLVCNVVPDLFPPRVQSRYDGQTLCFTYPAWENNRKEALEHDIVYKYLICETGLIETGKRKSALKKIKYRYVGKNATDAVTVHVNNQVYELTTSIDSIIHDTVLSFFRIKLARDGRIIGERNFPLTGKCPIEEDIGVEVSDKGFIIRIPYCDGHMFRIGYARFDYSEKYDDFILTEYREENIDRLDTEQKSKNVEYSILSEKPIVFSMFSPETIKRIIRQNLIREYEIVQTRTAHYPVFGYSSKENKLMWIEIPAEFVIQNNSPQRLYVLGPSYYGYAYETGYRLKENPTKGWSRVLLYRVEEDSIGSYLRNSDPIFPKESNRYIINSRIFVYKNPEFQKLFEDTVASMFRKHKESRWRVTPSSLSPRQRKFIRQLISGDSLRVRLYSDSLDRRHSVNIPLDVGKRFNLP